MISGLSGLNFLLLALIGHNLPAIATLLLLYYSSILKLKAAGSSETLVSIKVHGITSNKKLGKLCVL
jgi:hypothetical protein